ncbi:MAG TPA: hypothetical protein VKT49_06980 [Bryobacteraceae bacterium]|nr:hypothetical protein [Bryobacteraceae bacterium]
MFLVRKPWSRRPSLVDAFLLTLLLVLFGRRMSWEALLADGDTGWHIRTGEWILAHGAVPVTDPFSFSRSGQPWFAWEWLTDIIFALLHRWLGLAGIVGLTGLILCLAAALLACWLLRRGAGLWIATGVTLAAVSASSVHYLARPHLFSLLLFTAALWILDEDRRRRTGWVWTLPALAALWANLHGGFVAWLGTLAFLVGVLAAQRNWSEFRRYGALAALSGAATLANPYGWRLHQHIFEYLRSSWILDNVQEFQSPSIRSENMLVFAVLLLAGAALASRALARGRWFAGGMVLLWGMAALRSARHIPLFAAAAAPVIADECAAWWAAWSARATPRSAARIFWELGQDLGRSRAFTWWAPVLGGAALFANLGPIADFPPQRFPVSLVSRQLERLAAARVLTSDQWADYLIYRGYPRQRVFFDGRSDFYGLQIGADYRELLRAGPRSAEVLARYGFETALLPREWPLVRVLERDPAWRRIDREADAELFVRQPPFKTLPLPADATKGGI